MSQFSDEAAFSVKREMEDPDSSSVKKAFTIKYKRPRGSRACTVCRSRKVRCDAEIHIPCTNCVTFGCECNLPEPKKRLPGSIDLKSQKKPVDPSPISSTPVQPSNDPFQFASVASIKVSNETVANISTQNAISRMPKINSDTSRYSEMYRFLGSSSGCNLMGNVMGEDLTAYPDAYVRASPDTSLDSVELEILRLRGVFLLPSNELCLEIFDCYFEHVHHLMPILNRKEFMEKFNNKEDPPSLMLIQAVLLSGSRLCESPLLLDANNTTKLATNTFYKRAKALYEANVETDPVAILQTLLLLSWFWEGPDDVTKNSFYWIRVAITIAQGFGFQRDVSNSPRLSDSEKKTWRKIFWCLLERDRTVAVSFGRPTVIDLADCDVPMLTLDDFTEGTPEDPSPYLFNELHAQYYIHLVKLAEVTGIILKQQYSVKPEMVTEKSSYLVVQQCDMLMGVWFNNLPPSLMFSLTDASTHNFFSSVLNAQYYIRLFLVHRSNLLRMLKNPTEKEKMYPSWGIAFQSTYMMSVIGKTLLAKNQIKYTPANFVYIFLTAFIMSLYHLDSSNTGVSASSYETLNVCRDVLKECAKVWPVALLPLQYFQKYAHDKVQRQGIIAQIQKREASRDDLKKNEYIISNKLPDNIAFDSNSKTPESNANGLNGVSSALVPFVVSESPESGSNILSSTMSSSDSSIPVMLQSAPSSEKGNEHINRRDSLNGIFPELTLVTETMPDSNSNFFENFDPSQLFPEIPSNVNSGGVNTPIEGAIGSNMSKLNGNFDLTGAVVNDNNVGNMYNNVLNYNSLFSSSFNLDQVNSDAQGFLNEELKSLFSMSGFNM